MKDHMDSQDKLILVLDKISEVSERTVRMEVQMNKMDKDIENIKQEDKLQNELLDKHIQGTVANTERLNLEIEARRELESRVKKLEKVPQFMSSLYKIGSYIALAVGIVYEAGRILKKW